MRDTGRRLFGLAIQYMSRTRDHEPVLDQGRRIGSFYGQKCAERDISLADTIRALFFFRDSLYLATRLGQISIGRYDAEDERIHQQLRSFLDEVTVACLSSYEDRWRIFVDVDSEARGNTSHLSGSRETSVHLRPGETSTLGRVETVREEGS